MTSAASAAPVTADPTATPRPTATPTPPEEPTWSLEIVAIDTDIRAQIEPTSWREGCPVGLDELRLLRFPHVNFSDQVADGQLIVASDWAEQVGAVFEELFEQRYQIESIQLIDRYGGDDQLSMQANNTSAFNCREVAYRPGVWSNHAFGQAIDLNPLYNPYISGDFVDPAVAEPYVDRSELRQGMIAPGDPAVIAFERIGWVWGGTWATVKDYQHFSANGG